jgi:hypothetical protein
VEIHNLISTEQLKIVRERREYVQLEIYCWGNQQKFDILDIEKIGEWSSPNINIVAYSREMLYRVYTLLEFYFGKGRRIKGFNFTWLELRRSEEAQTISTEQ